MKLIQIYAIKLSSLSCIFSGSQSRTTGKGPSRSVPDIFIPLMVVNVTGCGAIYLPVECGTTVTTVFAESSTSVLATPHPHMKSPSADARLCGRITRKIGPLCC